MNKRFLFSESGFTLAELLIALAILGVIATFTIPKILVAVGNQQSTAIVKDDASMVAGAYSAYQNDNAVATSTTQGWVTSYLNYVKIETNTVTNLGVTCSTANTACLQLHNGGYLHYSTTATLAGVDGTHYWIFNVDPDGTKTTLTAGSFFLFGNGRLTSAQNAYAEGGSSAPGAVNPAAITTDPSWLTW